MQQEDLHLNSKGACKPLVLTRGNFNTYQDCVLRTGWSCTEMAAPRAAALRRKAFPAAFVYS